nr:hypothetical protein [Streptomyces tsukubensis]
MRIRIVDAFTDRPFAGNPAGVVLLDPAAGEDDGFRSRHVPVWCVRSHTATARS